MAGEFEIIARYLKPLALGAPGALDLTDDAALLDVPPGETLVVAADAIVEGLHYLPDDPPETVGRKLLRVNLSDLAAMGARPLGYLTTLSLPRERAEDWVAGFAEGLAGDQERFGLCLHGGDMTRTEGPAALSLTILGCVPAGGALRRGAVRAGDRLYVSGTIGDATLGLAVLHDGLDPGDPARRDALLTRYRLPEPRLALGRALLERGLAAAAIDVSDGLLADAGHLAETSGLRIEIEAQKVPRSEAAQEVLERQPDLAGRLLTGGDDYELLFAAAAEKAEEIEALSGELDLPLTRIGQAREPDCEEPGIDLIDREGILRQSDGGGWSHF